MGSRVDKVRYALEQASGPLSIRQIAEITGLWPQQVGVALRGLKKYRMVEKTEDGWIVAK